MEINPFNRAGTVNSISLGGRPAGPAPVATDQTAFAHSAVLESDLRRVPDVRISEVERARELVADVHYPPEIGIQRLSALLAIRLAADA